MVVVLYWLPIDLRDVTSGKSDGTIYEMSQKRHVHVMFTTKDTKVKIGARIVYLLYLSLGRALWAV